MHRALVATAALAALLGCGACERKPSAPAPVASRADLSDVITQAEAQAAQREAERPPCSGKVTLYSGSIAVDSKEHQHAVERDGDYVEAPIDGLDKVVSTAPELRFTLEYPFEKPFSGRVKGPVTLRRIIDAVRAGFRQMYEGATQRDIPGLYNKDVRGPYGRAFHAIDDLVIEHLELCDDGSLEIGIGS
ncbi:MAG: hypothetical protein HY828_10285 [Actinobacteria bacterium]|nr:hypothetical protein [Actinomycetota bacterium]